MLAYTILTGIFYGLGNTTDNTTAKSLYSLVAFVIVCFITFGYCSYFLKISRDEKVEWRELFSKTNLAFDCFIISLVTALAVFVGMMLLVVPGIIVAIMFSQAYFIKLDNPDMKAIDTLSESARIIKGHKMDYFLLGLSFLGWLLLGLFTFGILYFWLTPYMSVTMCNFYNKIKDEKK